MRIITALLLASAPVAFSSPLPGYQPAPPSRLVQGHFRIPDANCEIPTPPGDGWQWYIGPRYAHLASYLCFNASTGEALSVASNSFPATAIRPSFLTETLNGMRAEASRGGRTVQDVKQQELSTPTPGTVRLSYSLAKDDGPATHVFSYAVPTGFSCLLTMPSQEAREPEALAHAVRGLRLLRANRPEAMFPELAAVVSPGTPVVFGLLAYGGAALVGAISRRRVNPWTAVLVVLVLVGIFNLVVLKRADVFDDLTAKDCNRLILSSLAGPTLGAAFAYWRRMGRTASVSRPAADA